MIIGLETAEVYLILRLKYEIQRLYKQMLLTAVNVKLEAINDRRFVEDRFFFC
jgi:hypothetical protein